MGRQASSFILRLCGGGKEKEKKKKYSNFVACVAVSLKLVVLYYVCGAASLYFVLSLCGGKLVVLYYACRAASL